MASNSNTLIPGNFKVTSNLAMVCFEITLKKPSGVAKFAVAVHWSCLWAATTKRIGQTCNSDIDSPCILQAAIFESLH